MSDPNTDEVEEVEEEEEPEEVIDVRLKKSVEMLLKQSKIDPEKIKGMELEEQFDKLSFLIENMVEPSKPKKSKNKPVVKIPSGEPELKIGRYAKGEHGEKIFLLKPHEWIKQKKVK